jgi:hypothetical protein
MITYWYYTRQVNDKLCSTPFGIRGMITAHLSIADSMPVCVCTFQSCQDNEKIYVFYSLFVLVQSFFSFSQPFAVNIVEDIFLLFKYHLKTHLSKTLVIPEYLQFSVLSLSNILRCLKLGSCIQVNFSDLSSLPEYVVFLSVF